MNRDQDKLVRACVFFLLIAIGVAGRWGQPQWCFTPMAAVTLFAGFYFSSRLVALLVPLAIMSITDLLLPAYDRMSVMIVVYAALLFPVILGWRLREKVTAVRLLTFAVLPAVAFWLASNLAVWCFRDFYPHTFGGLVTCYVAALPFFRNMLLGDLLYVAFVFGSYAIALSTASQQLPATHRR